MHDIDGLVKDCSYSSVLAMELLQSCAKPSIYAFIYHLWIDMGVNKIFRMWVIPADSVRSPGHQQIWFRLYNIGSCGFYPMSASLEYIGNLSSVIITAAADSQPLNTITMSLNSYDFFKCQSPIYTDPNCIITVPADGPAPDGAWPSAGTVIINNCICFLWYFCGYRWWCIMVLGQINIGSGMACRLMVYYQ